MYFFDEGPLCVVLESKQNKTRYIIILRIYLETHAESKLMIHSVYSLVKTNNIASSKKYKWNRKSCKLCCAMWHLRTVSAVCGA